MKRKRFERYTFGLYDGAIGHLSYEHDADNLSSEAYRNIMDMQSKGETERVAYPEYEGCEYFIVYRIANIGDPFLHSYDTVTL